MKFLIVLSILIIIAESYPYGTGTMFLKCPYGDPMINCNEVKCCPSNDKICCLDSSVLNEAIRIGCTSRYPQGHPLGC
jgi:hypothetical protein